jgi:hypothetical protein
MQFKQGIVHFVHKPFVRLKLTLHYKQFKELLHLIQFNGHAEQYVESKKYP